MDPWVEGGAHRVARASVVESGVTRYAFWILVGVGTDIKFRDSPALGDVDSILVPAPMHVPAPVTDVPAPVTHHACRE